MMSTTSGLQAVACPSPFHDPRKRAAYARIFGPVLGCRTCRERFEVRCRVCHGTGHSDGRAWGRSALGIPCEDCGGTGRVYAEA